MGKLGIADNYGVAQGVARAVLNYWYGKGSFEINDLGAQVMAEMIISDTELMRRFCNSFVESYTNNQLSLVRESFSKSIRKS